MTQDQQRGTWRFTGSRWPFVMLLATVLGGHCSTALAGTVQSNVFRSSRGFTIEFPPTWVSIAPSDEQLTILSGNDRVEAVIVAKGESLIQVGEFSAPPNFNVRDYMAKASDAGLSRYEIIKLTKSRHKNACDTVEKGDVEFEVAPGSTMHHVPAAIQEITLLICLIGERAFKLSLTRWRADGRSKAHEKIAVKMMASLRLTDD